ncbi:MAG: DUF4065 domain-containing protein [Propionibacteriaceae bacterium]|nr:DUF4065 domain-containing protein [Propionibacteriaceae bacterium]
MATAQQVLAYMKSLGHSFLGEVQAQKLVYYAQGWNLAWDGGPLFDEAIEAWEMGPVIRSLRGGMDSPEQPSEELGLSDQQQENIRAVVDFYGALTGVELKELTHTETPWAQTYAEKEEKGTSVIPTDLMREEYSRQSAQDAGPRRVPVELEHPDPADLHQWVEDSADQWSHTLSLLAQ